MFSNTCGSTHSELLPWNSQCLNNSHCIVDSFRLCRAAARCERCAPWWFFRCRIWRCRCTRCSAPSPRGRACARDSRRDRRRSTWSNSSSSRQSEGEACLFDGNSNDFVTSFEMTPQWNARYSSLCEASVDKGQRSINVLRVKFVRSFTTQPERAPPVSRRHPGGDPWTSRRPHRAHAPLRPLPPQILGEFCGRDEKPITSSSTTAIPQIRGPVSLPSQCAWGRTVVSMRPSIPVRNILHKT